jgi:predicted Ser/Thr protein kinase
MAMEAGTRLGPYEIVAPLGAGGMGEVYRARDTRLDRSVALKVSKEAFSDRFEREARAVAALNHPHICTLYDVGPNYLVMELVDGVPLAGPLPVEKAVEYAAQILDALDAAHRQGITHRDLKPANILVTKQGIKLLDFGLATKASPLGGSSDETVAALTQQGQIVGTLQYMAPEQLQGQPVDARSDLFAFGCVLYELLSGQRAFDGSSQASVIAAILEREPAPIEQHPPLDRVIATCLAKDPDARFQNARDLKRDLHWAMEPVAGANARAAAWWRRPVVLAGAIVLAMAAGIAGTYAVRPAPKPPPVIRYELPVAAASIVWSPDGTRLAWVSGPGFSGPRTIFVRRRDEFEPRLLDTGEGRRSTIAFSPDGSEIAFTHSPVDSDRLITEIRRVPVEGGPTVRIATVDIPNGIGQALAWHAGNLYLAAGGQLTLVPVAGGPHQTLVQRTGSLRVVGGLQVINDGRDVLFVSAAPSALWTVPTAGGEPRTVIERVLSYAVTPTGYLLYAGQGSLMASRFRRDTIEVVGDPVPLLVVTGGGIGAFVVSSEGTLAYAVRGPRQQEPVWVTRAGGTVDPVSAELPQNSSYVLSPDGKHVLVRERTGTLRAWDIDRRQGFQIATDVTSRILVAASTQTIFFARSGTDSGIFRVDHPWTSPPLQVIKGEQSLRGVSPDGRRLVVPSASGDRLMNADGSGAPVPLENRAAFSPDGRWVAFTVGNVENNIVVGPQELWVRPEPDIANGRRLAGKASGFGPFWSPGGHELFYQDENGRWTSVSVLGEPSAAPVLGRPTEITLPSGIELIALAPDGTRFLATRELEVAPPKLAIVENFFEVLRAKVPVR